MERSQSNAIYLKLITTLSSDTIIMSTVNIYNKFKAQHGTNPNFGPEGVYVFVASLYLSLHDSSLAEDIYSAIDQVFLGNFTILDFSNQMDNIISRSNIDYEAWSSSFRYLKHNVKFS